MMKSRLVKFLPIIFIFTLSGCSLEDFYIIGTENGQNHTHSDGSYIPGVDESVSEDVWIDEIIDNNFFYKNGNIIIDVKETIVDENKKESTTKYNFKNDAGKIYLSNTQGEEFLETYVSLSDQYDQENDAYLNSTYYVITEVNKKQYIYTVEEDFVTTSYKELAGLYEFDYSKFEYNKSSRSYIASNYRIENVYIKKAEIFFSRQLISKIILTYEDGVSVTNFSSRGYTSVTLPEVEEEKAENNQEDNEKPVEE